jgi:hypothetical protein
VLSPLSLSFLLSPPLTAGFSLQVRAYTFGPRMFAEVDVVLPADMPLREAHDIGESLQNKIESLVHPHPHPHLGLARPHPRSTLTLSLPWPFRKRSSARSCT